MLAGVIDLAFNVGHGLEISPPNYVRSILGDWNSWSTAACPPTELQLAQLREWNRGLPALAHILIPALPWEVRGVRFPFSDLLFRPAVVFRYPAESDASNPTPNESWFFINGICTDHSVVLINARYLRELFKRPLTVLHNFTRGFIPDLAACAVGKEWDRVTESAAVAFPHLYAALKDEKYKRIILLAHSQGTILSAVILALLQHLHPSTHAQFASAKDDEIAPERRVARRLARRWRFELTMHPPKSGDKAGPPTFEWPRYGRRQPERVSSEEMQKLEIYCFANCASEMVAVRRAKQTPTPWIESYGNEKDIVARYGVLANVSGPGSVRIDGDRYERHDAWGHLLNAHYLFPMMKDLKAGNPRAGLTPLKRNWFPTPRLFDYLGGNSPPHL
jgi:hypothetical protein